MTVRELSLGETALAYRALTELRADRPALASPAAFVAWVDERQRPEGYRLVAVLIDGVADAVAVAGFRRQQMLARGDFLYIDDLVTVPELRGHGHADALFAWLLDEAVRLGCEQVHLDSGLARHAAHRFYLNHRMEIGSLHFQRPVVRRDEQRNP